MLYKWTQHSSQASKSRCSHWHRGEGNSDNVASLWSCLNTLASCDGEVFLPAERNRGKKQATAEGFHLREGRTKGFWPCCLASPLVTTEKAFSSSHTRFAWFRC